MKIQVGGLSEGIHEYRFLAEVAEVGLGDQFVGEVTVQTTLDKSPNQLLLKADIEATGSFECDRCITRFEVVLPSSYQMYYMMEGSEHAQIDPSEVQIVPAGFSVIDLTEDVRQTILLSVPLKVLCSDQCKGLCPHCGTNLNTGECKCAEPAADVRWEKLRQLRQ